MRFVWGSGWEQLLFITTPHPVLVFFPLTLCWSSSPRPPAVCKTFRSWERTLHQNMLTITSFKRSSVNLRSYRRWANCRDIPWTLTGVSLLCSCTIHDVGPWELSFTVHHFAQQTIQKPPYTKMGYIHCTTKSTKGLRDNSYSAVLLLHNNT